VYGREMFETWYKMAAMLQSGLDNWTGSTRDAPERASDHASTDLTNRAETSAAVDGLVRYVRC